MFGATLNLVRFLPFMKAPVHAVALFADGSHILVGTEKELALFARSAEQVFRYALPDGALPFIQCAVADDMRVGVAAQRSGEIFRLEFIPEQSSLDVNIARIWHAQADINSLSMTDCSELIALGHYSSAITLLDQKGEVRWRSATKGRTWVTAFDVMNKILYVGSSSPSPYRLAALSVEDGAPVAGRLQEDRVMGMAALPSPLAVAVTLSDEWQSRLAGMRQDLRAEWIYEGVYGEFITALASDPDSDVIVLGTNTGRLIALQATTGDVITTYDIPGSIVLSLSIANGQHVAAGLEDGQVALFEYIPPYSEDEFVL